MLKSKLSNIISGYRINQDDGEWLLAILSDFERLQAKVAAMKEVVEAASAMRQANKDLAKGLVVHRGFSDARAELDRALRAYREKERG